MAGTGCDLSEEELLAMLKGIDASKIQKQTAAATSTEVRHEASTTGSDCIDAISFLAHNPEEGDLNQYWYSRPSIERMVAEVKAVASKPYRVAFISTPSLFFSLTEQERENCVVLDYDRKWENAHGFVFYDFNAPEDLSSELLHDFDLLVIDPPFITHDVWEKYTTTAKLLLRPGGKILLSTIDENEEMISELLDCHRTKFRPRIPNLVYQYSLYTNYKTAVLDEVNSEIGF